MTVQIIWHVRISEGQIIRAILYAIQGQTARSTAVQTSFSKYCTYAAISGNFIC